MNVMVAEPYWASSLSFKAMGDP
uniref:Uncharacterized protein n=1 Tax=Rhizophora mucronata TaxID=61149 RepID=A0A2P2IYX4_RHIMU